MRIIFLDFDGVLNNTSSESKSLPYSETMYNKHDSLVSPSNYFAIQHLFSSMYKQDIKLVVSSDWRCGAEKEVKQLLQLYFGHFIIDKIFYGCTPVLDTIKFNRGDEINLFINTCLVHINKEDLQYLVIDDSSHNGSLNSHPFVKIDREIGFTLGDYAICISKFMVKRTPIDKKTYIKDLINKDTRFRNTLIKLGKE